MNEEDDFAAANQMPEKKPLLIYDGNCDFCIYWVNYWQKLTGSKVIYKPYQEIAAEYPSISRESFQKAAQYIAPNGQKASGAEASFLTLSHAKNRGFWLWLYRKLPGFAGISEFFYALIASHRSFFYRVSILLWGHHYEPPQHQLITWFFLRILGCIFFAAFFSFGTQALGLIGSKGIIPITELIEAANQQIGIERYWFFPMVFWLNSSNFMIQSICWLGAILSLLLVLHIYSRISLFFLYLFYLSLTVAGLFFMSFQWDMLLLETATVTIILASSTTVGIWLLRWLLFRFIWVGGLVKIASGDPTWQNLTALNYYFYTQPLPTPLAWYANQLPHAILKSATALTLIIELFLPFLIFFPRKLRFIAAFAILLLQTIILITGNYNFFNLLTIAMCLSLFDDAAIRKIIPEHLARFLQHRVSSPLPSKIAVCLMSLFAVFIVFISMAQLNLRFRSGTPLWIAEINNIISPLRIVNLYGPFAVITTERMEIVIEGSNDSEHWAEYSFKYKPGDIYRRPLWNIPLQPRLDWQMWFAALGSPEDNPWFSRFMQRLLENSPDVLGLLGKNPFPNHPPTYIRAQFYEYLFTNETEKEKTSAWWKRRLIRLYFLESHL